MSETTTPDPIIVLGIHKGKKSSEVPLDYLKKIICFHWMKPPHVETVWVEAVKAFIKSKDPSWEFARALSPHAVCQTRKIKTKEEQTKAARKGKKSPAVPKETYEVLPETEA